MMLQSPTRLEGMETRKENPFNNGSTRSPTRLEGMETLRIAQPLYPTRSVSDPP